MIVAKFTTDEGNRGLILGLSRENINRLVAGKPIHVTRKTHGPGIPEGWTIDIIFGETEMEMQQQFRDAGVIGPDTKVIVDPRLRS